MNNDYVRDPPEEYLAHYGIKGQEWYRHLFGRWQNQAMYAVGDQRYADVTKSNPSIKDLAVKKYNEFKNKTPDQRKAERDAINDFRVQMASRGSNTDALAIVARNSTVGNVLAGPIGGTLANIYLTDKKIDSYNTRYGDGAKKGVIDAIRNYSTIGNKKNRISTIDQEFNSKLSESTIKNQNLSKEYVVAYSSKMEKLLENKHTQSKIERLNERNAELSLEEPQKGVVGAVKNVLNSVGNVAKLNAAYNLGLNRLIARISPTGATSVLEGAVADAKRAIHKGKVAVTSTIDKATGLPLKNATLTADQDMALVNPGYKGTIQWLKGGDRNCYSCTLTYEMRRRGYDVTAGFNGGDVGAMSKYFPKAVSKTFEELNSKKISKVVNFIKEQGKGARGNATFIWNNNSGGHSVVYEVLKDGSVIFRDCQTNKVFDPEWLLQYASSVEVTRMDNVAFNLDTIKRFLDI